MNRSGDGEFTCVACGASITIYGYDAKLKKLAYNAHKCDPKFVNRSHAARTASGYDRSVERSKSYHDRLRDGEVMAAGASLERHSSGIRATRLFAPGGKGTGNLDALTKGVPPAPAPDRPKEHPPFTFVLVPHLRARATKKTFVEST